MIHMASWGASRQAFGMEWSPLTIFGLFGNGIFSARFLVQWIASERQGESVIPLAFWYLSIAGSVILFTYFVVRHDPVGTLAYVPNSFIYARNLWLIRKRGPTPAVAAAR